MYHEIIIHTDRTPGVLIHCYIASMPYIMSCTYSVLVCSYSPRLPDTLCFMYKKCTSTISHIPHLVLNFSNPIMMITTRQFRIYFFNLRKFRDVTIIITNCWGKTDKVSFQVTKVYKQIQCWMEITVRKSI